MKIVARRRASFMHWIKSVTGPLAIGPLKLEAPVKILSFEVESQQAIEPGGCKKNMIVLATDLMAMFQVTIMWVVLSVITMASSSRTLMPQEAFQAIGMSVAL